LDAVREDPAPEPTAAVEEPPAPEPESEVKPAPIPEPEPAATPSRPPARGASGKDQPPPDTWLQIGTALMIERLTAAGMPLAPAESHVEGVYTLIGLTQANGSPISLETIRAWRSGVTTLRQGGWRGSAPLKRKVAGRPGVNPVVEAQQRVAEMAAVFKRMIRLGASGRVAQ
jgi:hypothetical protein